MDGVPAGMALSVSDFAEDLKRRQGGGGIGTTPRQEADIPQIVSGVFEGHTTGAPLAILFRNDNTRSSDYNQFTSHPRPSHADWVAAQKFSTDTGGEIRSWNDPRGGGHFSGRLTLALVAAGVVAKKILACEDVTKSVSNSSAITEIGGGNGGGDSAGGGGDDQRNLGIRVSSEIIEIGGESDSARFEGVIAAAMAGGDSIGGVVECRADGVPVGLGEPFFDSVESVAAHLFFAIPGVKGVEFGSGFAGSRVRGSENNDPIVDARGTTATNHAGGVNGGLTNGNQVVVRVAIKPTASISRPQRTWNFATGAMEELRIGGRHDACIALRAAVVCEAALAIALCDLMRR